MTTYMVSEAVTNRVSVFYKYNWAGWNI